MKPNTIEVIPEAISATIDVLWGTQAVGVAARTYEILERLAREQYDKGWADFADALTPMPPEHLYGDDMWPPQSVRLGNEECTIQHDSGDEQPDYDYPVCGHNCSYPECECGWHSIG